MAKKTYLWGMLALALVFGMAVAGCDGPDLQIIVVNECDEFTIVSIQLSGNNDVSIYDDTIALAKGQSASYSVPDGVYRISAMVRYTGEGPEPPGDDVYGYIGLVGSTGVGGRDSAKMTLTAYLSSDGKTSFRWRQEKIEGK